MTPEHKQKIKEGKDKAKSFFASQVIIINPNWRIERIDDYNWGIIRTVKGKEQKDAWYYGKLIDALNALPHKILDEAQIKDLKSVSKSLDEIEGAIERLMLTRFDAFRSDLQDGMSNDT